MVKAYAVLFSSLFFVASAVIKWSVSESSESKARRLAIQMTTSTTDYDSEDCVVGGFDEEDPTTVYVGGPCSELNVTMDGDTIKDVTPKVGFRYVAMMTLAGGLRGKDGSEVPMSYVDGSAFMFQGDEATHAEVGTAAHIVVKDTFAGMVLAQASYLSKASFDFKTNAFPFYKDPSTSKIHRMEACVTPCCATNGCMCSTREVPSKCSGAAIPVKPGQYKYSIFAAAADLGYGDPSYNGNLNGWEMLRKTFGANTSDGKVLSGFVNVDQAIDFSAMKSDAVIVEGPSSSVKYVDMKNYKSSSPMENVYEVKSFSIESDGGFSASYEFPTTYGGGAWTMDPEPMSELWGVGHVKIYAVKFSNTDLVKMGLAATEGDAATKKIVFLRYEFDVTGITGGQYGGAWYAYDPTITSRKKKVVSGSSMALPSFALLSVVGLLAAVCRLG